MDELAEITQLETRRAEILLALSSGLRTGAQYSISSGASSRSVTLADRRALNEELANIDFRLRELNGTAGFTIQAGW